MEKFDNTLHNIHFEQSILGSILIDPNLLSEITLSLKPSDFYSVNNRLVYEAMLKYVDEKDNLDLDIYVLSEILKTQNKLEKIGGLDYLLNLVESAYSSANALIYLDTILEYSKKRKLLDLSRNINEQLYNNIDSKNILENSQLEISKLYNDATNNGVIRIDSLVYKEFDRIKFLKENPLEETKIKTKYRRYDEITKGLHPGNLIILAARPSVGKTTLSLNIGLNVAESGKKVLIFSLEMGEDELLKKLISIVGKIDLEKIKELNFISNTEIMQNYSQALDKLAKMKILIDAGATPTISNIKNTCRNIQREGDDIGLIIIDYLQLIQGNSRTGSREQEISEISRGLKLLAKELNVPILALSQLSRKVDSREDKRPILSDLRESGSIEQDADQVLFIFNPEYHQARKNNIAEVQKNLFPIELLLAKHRNGQTGSMVLLFEKSKQTFLNPTPEFEHKYYTEQTESE
ncbi:replicative DNA helicase [Streptobacillus notomytis]|uniref:replicative DNA helicase n=1 Tax=Streptobacillus notomytis TaxID=1712031 RepID=UPI00082D049E|nr:replicative DNA helicase [Streptobacillus notomytis]